MIANFSSDTTSGVSDEIMNALISANKGYELGYFKDEHTKNVKKSIYSACGSGFCFKRNCGKYFGFKNDDKRHLFNTLHRHNACFSF